MVTPESGADVRDGRPSAFTLRAVSRVLDKAQRLQAPQVKKYVDGIRRRHPDETPQQIIERLEKHYLRAVTGAGSAVGAAAAVPGVGTAAALGAATGETALFIEAAALLALAVAEVHGIPVHDNQRRTALVMAVALGEEGVLAVSKVVGSRSGTLRRLNQSTTPDSRIGKLNHKLATKLARKYAIKRAPLIFGKLLPAGIGALIGGVGNRALGKKIIANSRAAFGPPPRQWPVIDGSVVDGGGPDTGVAVRNDGSRRRAGRG
ncbi:hypothetical protein GII33_07850 [Gordonia pseudamarae]|uniref:EcsC family protein n=1 Tax=Gordonia pseudamarae TaxID=2831662 RepID=A0ABX6IG25_9ACTN|nr:MULTISPECIES: hypothetical protein [Gordonia]MBD0023294.1 hypothetical protein [Gordonia sp. (in: high G+C Gram-positive bacteria)]QHN25886.1 hypothetical protein GII33_07850 [Gordonia pseudamarae]QHN34816.1 hypothetical protein GII31_07820 [Gordonia pseudamarae]